MRTFTIVMPGLSAGKPGATVTAEALGMDDDQLDEWVEYGFGAEVASMAADEEVAVEPDAPADTSANDVT